MKRMMVKVTRGGNRVFAKKARPSRASVRNAFLMRGGGYL